MSTFASTVTNLQLTRRYPASLVHFVTNRCNARCPFCFIDFDNPETFANELSLEEIEKITLSAGPELQNVNLTGGEPFARKDFLEIARLWLRNTQIQSIFITSNGSLPDRMEAFSRTLNEEFPDRKIIFSLSIDNFPEEHNKLRKIKNLFEKAMESYRLVTNISDNVLANIAITVSHANHGVVGKLYDALIDDYGVRAITATAVRDEGVYKIPEKDKNDIVAAYQDVTQRISHDLTHGRLEGYDPKTLQGRLMNKKNMIVNKIITDMYLDPYYVSPCHAGALFGVIGADGIVYPCEILDKDIGSLRDFDFDLMKLWEAPPAQEMRTWIRKTKCHCTYECAWTFNVLGNARYQPQLLTAALGLD